MEYRSGDKPKEIIDFSHVFKAHPKESFVGRKKIFHEINKFIEASEIKSTFLFIQGEFGIGKTALIANYIYEKQNDIIHYFVEYDKKELFKVRTFLKHLYYSLGQKYSLDNDNTDCDTSVLIRLLQKRINIIGKRYLGPSEQQSIVIDAPDEIPYYRMKIDISIIDIFNNITFPDNFRVIISSSRKLTELNDLYDIEDNNKIILTATTEGNTNDIITYLQNKMNKAGLKSSKIHELSSKVEGNFHYASSILDLVIDRVDDDILSDFENYSAEYFDSIIRRVNETVGNEKILNEIWAVLRLISISIEPMEPEILLSILGLDRYKTEELFKYLEPYLNLKLYADSEPKCRLYLYEFGNHILNQKLTPIRTRKEQESQLIKYIEKEIEDGYFYQLPRSIIKNAFFYYPYYCQLEGAFSKPPKSTYEVLMTTQFYRHLYYFPFTDDEYSMNTFLAKIVGIALSSDNGKQIIQHYLYASAFFHIRGYDTYKSGILVDCLNEKSNINIEEILGLYKDNPKMIAQCAMKKYLDEELSGNDLQTALNKAFSYIKHEFVDLTKAYDLSKKFAKDWFPPDEEVGIGKSSGNEKRTSINAPVDGGKNKLSMKYDDGPIVVIDGQEIQGFGGSPYSFVMFLNLAARRKANSPEKGLAHKEEDLLDDSQGEKNYGNLQTILAHQNYSHLLKPNCNINGRLMRDRKVYLDIDRENIIIDESIRNYKSNHRKAVWKLLEDQDKRWPSDRDAKEYCRRLMKVSYYLIRCESLVDDAIRRLGYKMRAAKSLSEVKKLSQQADDILRRLRKQS